MNEEQWLKLNFEQRVYELRFWVFNKVADHSMAPLTGLHLDQYILETEEISIKNDQSELLTTLAYNCGFLHK